MMTENMLTSLMQLCQKKRISETHKINQGSPSTSSSPNLKKQFNPADPSIVSLIQELPIFTFSQYMQHVMFDPKQGYYSVGKVHFGSDGDFSTNTTKSKGLALLNALDMFRQWLDEGQPEKFYNYEAGGGNGLLASDTLDFLLVLSQVDEKINRQDRKWTAFYQALQYIIIELSPTLANQQLRQCDLHVKNKKLTVINGDATNFKPISKIDRFFANELVDDFPREAFIQDIWGRIFVSCKLQVIPKQYLRLKKDLYNLDLCKTEKQDAIYREQLEKINEWKIFIPKSIPSNVYIVSQSYISTLSKIIQTPIPYEFYGLSLSPYYFEHIISIIQDNPDLINKILINKPVYINTCLRQFVKMLESSDQLLLLDYGGIGKEVDTHLRYYGDNPTLNPYVNITHDVDFFELAQQFKTKDFEVVAYGHQSNLLNRVDHKLLQKMVVMLATQDDEHPVNQWNVNVTPPHKKPHKKYF